VQRRDPGKTRERERREAPASDQHAVCLEREVPVRACDEQAPTGSQNPVNLSEPCIQIGHVFKYFNRSHDIKAAVGEGHVLD
jgi:hypothetical protein